MADLNSLGYMIVSVYEYLYDLQDHKKMEFLNWFCRAWENLKPIYTTKVIDVTKKPIFQTCLLPCCNRNNLAISSPHLNLQAFSPI